MAIEEVKNVLGQEIEISVGWGWGNYSRYAWNFKDITKNCFQCPWCIDKKKAVIIIQKVDASKGRRRWQAPVESRIMGLCDWGKRTMILFPKDKLIGCASFGKKPTRPHEKEKEKEMNRIKINVETKIVGDPKIPIYKITVEKNNGIWEETFGSKEIAEAFLKGLRAAFSFTEFGFVTIPSIEAGS